MWISAETRKKVYDREWWRCEGCMRMTSYNWIWLSTYEAHHRHRKSQYKWKDRHDEWNISLVCVACHYSIHSWGNKSLDRELKAKADLAKPVHERDTSTDPDLIRQRQKRKANPEQKKRDKEFMKEQRKKSVEIFKKKNWWLTPSQVKYREQKKYFSWLSKSKK